MFLHTGEPWAQSARWNQGKLEIEATRGEISTFPPYFAYLPQEHNEDMKIMKI